MGVSIDLSGRRALVTGAGQHVGREIARSLGQAGAEVAVNDIVAERAQAVAEEIRAAGGRAFPAVFDVRSWEQVQRDVGKLAPPILVNNVGATGAGDPEGTPARLAFNRFAESEPAEWDAFLSVNLYGVLHCTRAAVPTMLQAGWGRVITIISDAARVGEPRMAAYAAAKAGAAGFSRALASEVGARGVTVNCVSLGTIEAREPTAPEQRARRERVLQRYALGRLGRPTDPAVLVTFLASEHASWITGQTLAVNGGYSSTL
jgi:3-oxoacyl-[acyl-carrier protein] reductase